jgi:hypothetical protein
MTLSIMTLSIMTLSIMTISLMVEICYSECHYCFKSIMPSVAKKAYYADCRYAECRYAECRGTRVINYGRKKVYSIGPGGLKMLNENVG